MQALAEMPVLGLAEIQEAVSQALVSGTRPMTVGLVGGANPLRRLAVHERHFVTSLTAALAQRFPACAWLTNADVVAGAARAFVRARPPRRPCIAEYGREFPEFLADFAAAGAWQFLRWFAELEWRVGHASIAVDMPPLEWTSLAGLGAERLLDARLRLQPGLGYLAAPWDVADLMTAYLRGAAPFAPTAAHTYIEIRGARGELSLVSLDAATHTFRAALAASGTIADAATGALEVDGTFDAGRALRRLVAAGLATGVVTAPGV
jgi:hypothetical protein